MSWLNRFLSGLRSTRPDDERVGGAGAAPPTEEIVSRPALALRADDFSLRVGVVSEVGNVREHNEDNYFVPGRPSLHAGALRIDPSSLSEPVQAVGVGVPTGLFLVADGMGGQLAGEKASEMAVDIIPSELRRRLEPAEDEKGVVRAIRDGIAEANKEILAQSHLVNEYANMGTTIVLLLFRKSRAYVAGIGDSRAYRLRDGRLERLTRDHSLADALVGAGTIRPEEVENHKFKNVLYLYLGSKDARDGPEDVRTLDVRAGDRFLLASDGLTGVVRDETLAQILGECSDPQRAAQQLVTRALANKSKDNITCVVIHVV